MARGRKKEDIIAGLNRSVAKKVFGMVKRYTIRGVITFAGGVARNSGVRRALEEELGITVFVPGEPQIVGALGAALFAPSREGR